MIWWDHIKHFKPEELACPCCGVCAVDKKLVIKLDQLREKVGFPIIITSGYRCPKHNKEVGGKPDSAHIKGLAADISVSTSPRRYKLIKAAIEIGFKRIGIGERFIHLDIDHEKKQEVLWIYK